MNKRSVQNHLKEARQAAGLTQAQVGSRINASVNTISRYEKGVQCPSLEMALRLCACYHRKMDDLFELTEP